MLTCNRLHLPTLGSQLLCPKISPITDRKSQSSTYKADPFRDFNATLTPVALADFRLSGSLPSDSRPRSTSPRVLLGLSPPKPWTL